MRYLKSFVMTVELPLNGADAGSRTELSNAGESEKKTKKLKS
jgi:hypothetical protein